MCDSLKFQSIVEVVFLAHFMSRYCPLPLALILGNFTMTMLSKGFVALGWPATMQSVTTGFFLLVLLGVSSNQVRFIRWRMDRKRAKANQCTPWSELISDGMKAPWVSGSFFVL